MHGRSVTDTMRERRPAALLLLALSFAAAPSSAATDPRVEAVNALVRAGKLDEAVTRGESLAKESPSCGPCHLALGSAYGAKAQSASILTKMSWAKKCRASFARAVEIEPGSLDARLALIQFDVNAPGIAGGGIEKAKADAEGIAKLSPSFGRMAAGMIHEKEGDLAGAEKEYRGAASAADPSESTPLRVLVGFLERQKRPDEGFEVLRAYLARHPGDPLALYQVGRLSAASGKNGAEGLAALEAFLKAPPAGDRPPRPADARWRIGQILAAQGRKADAKASFEAALRESPGHPGATAELKKL